MRHPPTPAPRFAPAVASAALIGVFCLVPSAAEAQGSIQVRAGTTRGTPVSGTITARGQSGSYSCTLVSGGCVMNGVASGAYTVTLTVSGRAEGRRSVTVARTRVNVTFAVQPRRTLTRPSTTKVVARPGPTTTTRSTTPTGPSPAQIRPAPTLTKSLSSGTRVVVQGSAQFARGTPAVGHVEVRRGTALIGTSRITSGRFSIYDLPAGEYTLTLRERGGGTATRRVTVGRTPINVTLVVSP